MWYIHKIPLYCIKPLNAVKDNIYTKSWYYNIHILSKCDRIRQEHKLHLPK